MKVNHVNLTVTDAQAARRFFERYFGLVAMDGTTDTARFVGLQDSDAFVLTLMQPTDPEEVAYPASFHLGFLEVGKEQTHAVYRQMKVDEYDVEPPGTYRGEELYFATPWGFTVQVS